MFISSSHWSRGRTHTGKVTSPLRQHRNTHTPKGNLGKPINLTAKVDSQHKKYTYKGYHLFYISVLDCSHLKKILKSEKLSSGGCCGGAGGKHDPRIGLRAHGSGRKFNSWPGNICCMSFPSLITQFPVELPSNKGH